MKQRYTHGDERWSVEWTPEIPVDEYGDCDIDAAVTRRRLFLTRDQAMAFAATVAHLDAFGNVPVTRERFEAYDADINSHYGFWECQAEPEYVEPTGK